MELKSLDLRIASRERNYRAAKQLSVIDEKVSATYSLAMVKSDHGAVGK